MRLPRVPPGLATLGSDTVLISWVDGARVRTTRIAASGRAQIIEIGEGADQRFSPAVALHARGGLVAYTDGTGTPMRVRLAQLTLEGGVASRTDVTPQGLGAAAPTFAAGTNTMPELYFLEPRSGTSALYRVRFDADLTPTRAAVVRPIASVYEPPRIAVVASTPSVVAYTALGNAATTAVGLVPLGDASAPPVALLPGSAFGVLGLDAAALPGAAVFAFDTQPPANGAANGSDSWHQVRVRIAGASAESLTLGTMSDTPSIAAGSDGLVALRYSAPGDVYLSWLSCTP